MNDTSPADTLRAAADKLRPSSPAVAAHTVAVRLHPSVTLALAEWLEIAAEYADKWPPDHQTNSPFRQGALAVARAVLVEETA